jgi:hypothetical protein
MLCSPLEVNQYFEYILPLSSELKRKPMEKTSTKQTVKAFACCIFHAGFLFSWFLEDGGDMFLWNADWLSTDYMVLYPRRQNNLDNTTNMGAHSSVVAWGTMLQAATSQIFLFLMRSLEFSIDVIFPATLWPWGQLGFLQKWVPGIFLGVRGDRRIRITTSPPSVSWLSTKCARLNGLLEQQLYFLF